MPRIVAVDTTCTAVSIAVDKGATFGLLFPVYDSSPALIDATSIRGVARVTAYGGDEALLYQWSTADGTITGRPDGLVLAFDGAITAAWTFDQGFFKLDISVSGQPSPLAEGPFTARRARSPIPIP